MSAGYTFVLRTPRPAGAGRWGDAIIEERISRPCPDAEPRTWVCVKAALAPLIWDRFAPGVQAVFRRERHAIRWRQREVELGLPAGKQLTLLFWAAERTDLADREALAHILANWQGLAPEERGWLYAVANQDFGRASHGPQRGWRGALKQAFRENPIAPATLGLMGEAAE